MGIKKNIVYNSILTTANYVFPLIVYPYVSRVLGVNNIGICNFIDSIIHYFILASMMGVTILGTREIAASKAKRATLNSRFSAILTLNGITTLLALAILVVAAFVVPELRAHSDMMIYGAIKLISNFFLIEWFYNGLENFKFITVRTIAVKCLFVLSVFIFVKQQNDYATYYLLTALMITINSAINLIYSRHFASFTLKGVDIRPLIKPFFILGSYMLITSFCTTFNTVYLGFLTDDTQVGYYTTATKLFTILLALFTGVTSVIMPRMSKLLAEKNIDEFKIMLNKSIDILLSFSIPTIIFTVIMAREVVLLVSGPGYGGAVVPMMIVMPLILIIGMEQILVIQGLMPLKEDKTVMRNSLAGATVSILLNILLVSRWQSIGSSIAWLCSETTILLLSQLAISKAISTGFPFAKLTKNIIAFIPLAIILYLLNSLIRYDAFWIPLIVSGAFTATYVIIAQLLFIKNPIIINLLKTILHK